MKKSLRNLMIGTVMAAGIFVSSISAQAADKFVKEDMNFRAGASITSTIMGSVPEGAKVDFIGQYGEWDLVVYNGQKGFIHTGNLTDNYVAKRDNMNAAAPVFSQNNSGQNNTCQNNAVSYSTYSSVQSYYDNNWTSTASEMDAVWNGTWKTVCVKSGYLALRTDPSYTTNEIGQLQNGDVVMLIGGADGSYVRAYSPTYGTYGWVNAGFLN